MSGKRENLPDAGLRDEESLNVTVEELWAELDSIFCIETRQPGDMTQDEIATRYKVVKETVRTKMLVLIKEGKYKLISVMGPEGRAIKVYRRVK